MTEEPSRNGSDGPTGNGTGGDSADVDPDDVQPTIAGHESRTPPSTGNDTCGDGVNGDGTNGDGTNGDAPGGAGIDEDGPAAGGNGATPADSASSADGASADDGAAYDGATDDVGSDVVTGDVDEDEDEYLPAVEPVEAAPEDEVEPVELLVQLAKDGEIEPWDIDIVRVTDEFLARLDDADLRAGGRALFYASVLLRMKSDAMLQDGPADHEADARDGPMDDPAADGPAIDPFDQLEREMDRRLERKHARGTPRTLDELVRELRERERETYWKEHRSYDTSESPHGYARGTQELDYRMGDDLRMDDEPTEADAFGRTHDEHMEDTINEVYMALREQYDAGRDEVLFREVRDAGGTTVDTFLGLLFLANRGQVSLQQDELFGDLWVRDPAAVTETEEALAD
jgi:segregation and condensation protein A